jgi:hypothetical protein
MDNKKSARSILFKAFPGIKESDADEMIAANIQRAYPVNTILCIVSLTMAREVSRRLTQNDTMAIEDLRQKAR